MHPVLASVYPLDWGNGGTGADSGNPASFRQLQYAPDACGEPGAFRGQAGTQGKEYGTDSL